MNNDCAVRPVKNVHYIIDHIVDDMHRTAVYIKHDREAVLLKFMNSFPHKYSLFSIVPARRREGSRRNKKRRCRGNTFLSGLFLADLIANRAGRLTRRLAGCLTLAAAALVYRALERRLIHRLDVLHGLTPFTKLLVLSPYDYYLTPFFLFAQVSFRILGHQSKLQV